jgi:hypothetical protein
MHEDYIDGAGMGETMFHQVEVGAQERMGRGALEAAELFIDYFHPI